jgi:glycosyltransferase involved in cell wall biosynthesis
VTRISVVIPVLNDAAMLAVCLRGLRAQTRLADEVIVVDNGSSDDSIRVAEAGGARVIHEARPGITAASAAGFDSATGDIIARCDADSRLPLDWLERIEQDFLAHPDAVAVTGPGRFYDLGPVATAMAKVFYMNAYFFCMHAALGNNVLFGSNYAVLAPAWRTVSSSVPRDDTELHDDIDLSFRVHPSAEVVHNRNLVVGISGRPFHSLTSARRRISRAVHTLAVHWPDQSPSRRWRARHATLLRDR